MTVSTLNELAPGAVVAPGDPDWDAARRFHTGIGEPTVIVRASSVDDVRAALRYAAAERLDVLVRSGGHSAWGTVPGGLTIDLAALDDVAFNKSHRKNARMLAKSWRRTASRAREALDACQEDTAAGDFHELRKRTYDYRLYHALLRDLWPSAMKAKRDFAKDLVERLGHINDLAVLSGLVEAEPQLFTRNDDLAHLLDAIIFRQQEDRREALRDAETLYGDDPDDEAQRLDLLWVSIGN